MNNKLRLIFSVLFIIATTFSALHELEHIDSHNSSTCIVCTVSEHSLSFDIIKEFASEVVFAYEEIKDTKKLSYRLQKIFFNQANAPPKLS